jgi:hypothetical protein
MRPANTSKKKLPPGLRPRERQIEFGDGACLAHDAGLFKAASAIPHNNRDGEDVHRHDCGA